MNYRPPPKDLPSGSYVIEYLRDSGGDKQELSTNDQRKEIKDYCVKYGLILIEVFEDAARSGTSTVKRDEFERMIDQCRKNQSIQGVLVWNFARFARNVNDAMYYKTDLRRRGIIVHSITDEIPEGPYSHLIEVMIDTTNEEKSRQTSRDTKRGLAQRTLAGYSPGGIPPRGYKSVSEIISSHRDGSPRIGTKWEADPETAPLVTMAFKMRAQGISLNEIMKSPCGVLYKSKSCWSTFWNNKSYLGIGKCGETEVKDHHPTLIDLETWEAVQALQEKIHKRIAGNLLHPKRYHSPSLLSGIAVCIFCGTPIIREVSGAKSTKTGKWIAYLCGKKRNSGNWHACEGKQIQAAKADAAIVDTVLNIILTKDFANELIKQIRDQLSDDGEAQRQEQAARLALASCHKAISRLLDTIESTDSATAKDRLKDRENERARLQFEMVMMESRYKAAQLEITPEALDFMLEVWRGNIETARDQNDVRGLQRLIRQFVCKIELGYNNARLWYNYPIDAFTDERLSMVTRRDRSYNFLVFGRIKAKTLELVEVPLLRYFATRQFRPRIEAVFFCQLVKCYANSTDSLSENLLMAV